MSRLVDKVRQLIKLVTTTTVNSVSHDNLDLHSVCGDSPGTIVVTDRLQSETPVVVGPT